MSGRFHPSRDVLSETPARRTASFCTLFSCSGACWSMASFARAFCVKQGPKRNRCFRISGRGAKEVLPHSSPTDRDAMVAGLSSMMSFP